VALTYTVTGAAQYEKEDLQWSMEVEDPPIVIARRREGTPTAAETPPCKGDDWQIAIGSRTWRCKGTPAMAATTPWVMIGTSDWQSSAAVGGCTNNGGRTM
jgi:hypothetical protein